MDSGDHPAAYSVSFGRLLLLLLRKLLLLLPATCDLAVTSVVREGVGCGTRCGLWGVVRW